MQNSTEKVRACSDVHFWLVLWSRGSWGDHGDGVRKRARLFIRSTTARTDLGWPDHVSSLQFLPYRTGFAVLYKELRVHTPLEGRRVSSGVSSRFLWNVITYILECHRVYSGLLSRSLECHRIYSGVSSRSLWSVIAYILECHRVYSGLSSRILRSVIAQLWNIIAYSCFTEQNSTRPHAVSL